MAPSDPVQLTVDLLNTRDELARPPELIRDAERLNRVLRHLGLPETGTEGDVAPVRAVRDRIRAALETGDEDSAVARLNALLGELEAVPRLVRADGGWRLRLEPQHASVAAEVGAAAALALLELIRSGGWQRIGFCAGHPCVCVYVDRSRGRTRRYCCHLCADRANQAAYRARRRAR